MEKITYIINDYLYSISSATGMSLGVIGLIVGIALMLFGFKIKKIALMIIGFFAGYVGGTLLADRFIGPGAVMFTLTPILIGAAAAVLMFAVYYLAIYVMGLSIGGLAGFYLGANLFERPVWGLVIAVVLGVIIGSIALAAEKPIVILGTSFIGYIAFRQGLYALISIDQSIVIEVVCIVLALASVVLQFLINRNRSAEGRVNIGKDTYAGEK